MNNSFSQSVEQLLKGLIQVDAYFYSKKQIDYILKTLIPFIAILITLIYLSKK